MNKKTTTKSKKPQFKEYAYSGKTFEYSGRIYSGRDGSGKIVRRWPLSMTFNGVFTLKGVWLTQTKNNVFLSYPTWFDETAKEWKDYVFVDAELKKEMDGLINELCKLVGIDGNDDDEIEEAEPADEDAPF